MWDLSILISFGNNDKKQRQLFSLYNFSPTIYQLEQIQKRGYLFSFFFFVVIIIFVDLG